MATPKGINKTRRVMIVFGFGCIIFFLAMFVEVSKSSNSHHYNTNTAQQKRQLSTEKINEQAKFQRLSNNINLSWQSQHTPKSHRNPNMLNKHQTLTNMSTLKIHGI